MKKNMNYILYSISIIIVICTLFILINRFFPCLFTKKVNRQMLDKSLELGAQFMLNNQKASGKFNYEYDWILKKQSKGDNEVRQAGALWGLTLIFQDNSNDELDKAINKGFNYFYNISTLTKDGKRFIVYPNSFQCRTGTIALICLSYIDYLRTVKNKIDSEKYSKYLIVLNEYLKTLIKARTKNGLWHENIAKRTGTAYGNHSSYFDGEALLALVKAAKYLDRKDLIHLIIESADAGYEQNIKKALSKNPDSPVTKGYYQWSSMAFYEFATSGWQNTEKYGQCVINLAYWMIDVHNTLKRTRNTAYAYEGIIHAYKMAEIYNNKKAMKKFKRVIDQGLYKLTSWQVGHPKAIKFIKSHKTDDIYAIGGIQNHRSEAPLRIDVTQHQMHAVILARKYVYVK